MGGLVKLTGEGGGIDRTPEIDLVVLALTNSKAVILNACPPTTIHHSFVIVFKSEMRFCSTVSWLGA